MKECVKIVRAIAFTFLAHSFGIPPSLIGQKITFVDKNNPLYDYGLWIRPVFDAGCSPTGVFT